MDYTPEQARRVQQALLAQGISPQMARAALDEELMKASFAAPASTTTGINYYNLEPFAKRTFNAYTPVRNMLPRRNTGKGTAANWREMTSIDATKVPMGLLDGARGALLTPTVAERTAAYVEIGWETSATFLAEQAARGFDDIRALQGIVGLRNTQIKEEKALIGGLGTFALGTTPTPGLTPSNTGGVLTNAASPYHVRCVALSPEGYDLAYKTAPLSVATILTLTSASPRAQTWTVNGGAAKISADATTTIASGTTGSIAATVTHVPGAAGYAWFIGTAAGSEVLAAITTINAVTLTAVPSAGSPPTGWVDVTSTNFDTDRSQNGRIFDGIIAIMARSGSGATITSLDGASLTADNAAGIVEFDAILQAMASSYKVSPEDIWVNFEQVKDIATAIGSASAGVPSAYQIQIQNGPAQGGVMGGFVVKGYQNKYALSDEKRTMRLHVHPDIPPGTILFTSTELPPVAFPDANIDGVFEVETLEDYTQREWPLIDRQYESGVYVTETLKCYASFALGMLQCVKPA